jgi:hypothetical protein
VEQLSVSALDILALEEACPHPTPEMKTETRCRVGGEIKQNSRYLDKLIRGMQACQGFPAAGHTASDHKKCRAIELLRPRLFLAVAAGEDWRLFLVGEVDGRAALGRALPDLDLLHFDAAL